MTAFERRGGRGREISGRKTRYSGIYRSSEKVDSNGIRSRQSWSIVMRRDKGGRRMTNEPRSLASASPLVYLYRETPARQPCFNSKPAYFTFIWPASLHRTGIYTRENLPPPPWNMNLFARTRGTLFSPCDSRRSLGILSIHRDWATYTPNRSKHRRFPWKRVTYVRRHNFPPPPLRGIINAGPIEFDLRKLWKAIDWNLLEIGEKRTDWLNYCCASILWFWRDVSSRISNLT